MCEKRATGTHAFHAGPNVLFLPGATLFAQVLSLRNSFTLADSGLVLPAFCAIFTATVTGVSPWPSLPMTCDPSVPEPAPEQRGQ